MRGLRLTPPANLPVRPTKDNAKEALFNVLANRWSFDDITVLDLFSGTGNISIEFASRGVGSIVSVDRFAGCIYYLKDVARQYGLSAVKPIKADVLKFLKEDRQQYDIIFADPPYDLPEITTLSTLVFEQNLLKENGVLIIEHPSMKKLDNHERFLEQREYGYSSFSFFG